MHAMPSAARFRFGRFLLLAGEQRLLCDGREAALGPRALELLAALARRGGRMATKDELLDEVWPGVVVEEANLHVQVSQLRKVIGAGAIATIPGRGYRLAVPVQPEATAPTGVSIIVLPFVESGTLPGNEHFADALTDEITNQLARLPGSHVVASQAAWAYKREPFDLRAVGQQLGVRYALQGRVERSAAGVEASVRLADAHSGAVLWADCFTAGHAGSPAELRQDIAARVLNGATLELLKAQARLAHARPAQPGELLIQAGAIARTARAPEDFAAALRLLDQARELEPGNASLLAYRARVRTALVGVWPGEDADEQIAAAERDIMTALAQDASSAHAHCTLSRVRQLQLRIEAALTAVDQALELEPCLPEALAWRGAMLVYHGQVAPSLEPLRRALALAPRDPHRWGPLFWLGKSHLLAGRYDEAVPWLEKSAAIVPFWATHAFLAAANAHLGRAAETQAALALLRGHGGLRERSRRLRLSNHPVYRQLRSEHFVSGLRKAGAIDDFTARVGSTAAL